MINEYLVTSGIGVRILKVKAILKCTKNYQPVHKINLEPFKTSRIREESLIRDPTIFPKTKRQEEM